MVGGRWSCASLRGRGGNRGGGHSGQRDAAGQGNIEDMETQIPTEIPAIGIESTAVGPDLPEESPTPGIYTKPYI